MLITLGFPKPPVTITWSEIWSKIEVKLNELLKKLPPNYLGKALLNVNLTVKQWNTLSKLNNILIDDFKLRREMLLKRLDVTVQSFKWADRLKPKAEEITRLYETKRKDLNPNPTVTLADLLAARDGKSSYMRFLNKRIKQFCFLKTC